jgi:adhesin transport system membrane fusion protein
MTNRADFEYANNVRAAADENRPANAWLPLLVIIALILSALAWASTAVVEEVTNGTGRVIPSRQLQIVQTLEGGVVSEVLVQEGDRVEKNQLLMRIDETTLASRLGEMTKKRVSLLAEIARLEVEAGLKSDFDIASLVPEIPETVARSEQQVLDARRAKLKSDESVLRQQLVQNEQQLAEMEARDTKLEETGELLSREIELNQALFKRGAVPEVELLRLKRQMADIQGDLSINRASVPRANAAIQEAMDRIANVKAGFEAEAQQRLTAARGELAVIDESIKGASDRVKRTSLHSPVTGVVNKLNAKAIGAVLQPGQALAEIVPLDESLLIETRIRPQDVAFISPGQKANVKLSAYDYLIYGSIAGKVDRIGADTIADENGETFYKVMVRTERNTLPGKDHDLPIIPGMVARVDIQTGEKTILDYLLKPLLRARHEALRER